MTQFCSVNYICHVCKLKLLLWTCPKFWTILTLIGSNLQLLLNIFYHRSTAILFRTVLLIMETFIFWRKCSSKSCYINFFIQKLVTSITQEWLVLGSCPAPQWITFSMLYRLVYNIPYHLNDLILAWSGVLQWHHNVSP